MCAVCARSRRH
uniref:Uncharacterized protein n=1 Tax=Anopheles minimus TaxID=112268 RepID=A0A182WPL7_9DIPT